MDIDRVSKLLSIVHQTRELPDLRPLMDEALAELNKAVAAVQQETRAPPPKPASKAPIFPEQEKK